MDANGDTHRGGEGSERGDDAGRAAACARRAALPPVDRERVEATVSDLLDLLGRARGMALLREFAFADGPLRFTELESALGVSPSTLSARLRELTAAGLLSRREYDELPPRVEYRPTATAEALFPAFEHIHQRATEHRLEPSTGRVRDDGASP